METQLALSILKGMSNTLGSQLAGYQAQKDSVDLAISQLQGVLTTQLKELEDTKVELQQAQAVDTPVAEAPVEAVTPTE